MTNKPTLDELFERRINYPDVDAQERLAHLVGLDDHKARLTKILEEWRSTTQYPEGKITSIFKCQALPRYRMRTTRFRPGMNRCVACRKEDFRRIVRAEALRR